DDSCPGMGINSWACDNMSAILSIATGIFLKMRQDKTGSQSGAPMRADCCDPLGTRSEGSAPSCCSFAFQLPTVVGEQPSWLAIWRLDAVTSCLKAARIRW